jgi:hypothetical protein
MYVFSGNTHIQGSNRKKGERALVQHWSRYFVSSVAVEDIIVSVLLRSLANHNTPVCLNTRPLGQPVSSSTVYSAFPHAVSPKAGKRRQHNMPNG